MSPRAILASAAGARPRRPRRAGALLAAGLLAAALGASAAAPTAARADATFADASPWVWGVSAFELSLTIGTIVGVATGCERGCPELTGAFAGGGVLLGVGAGIVAALTDAPPDVPFVLHEGIWGSIWGASLAASMTGLARTSATTQSVVMVAAGTVFAGGTGVYAAVRRDLLMRSPEALWPAHYLAWGVPLVGILSLVAFSMAGIPPEGSVLLFALVSAIAYGIGVGWAESVEPGASAAGAPLLFSYGAAF